MKRPYISGPMSGIPQHNYPAFFEADAKLRSWGMEPLNPARSALGSDQLFNTWQEAVTEANGSVHVWGDYLRRDTRMCLESDGIVLLDGWERSKGACLELVVSICVGNPVYFYAPQHRFKHMVLHEVYDVAEVYDTALAHLTLCGLHGVRKSLV